MKFTTAIITETSTIIGATHSSLADAIATAEKTHIHGGFSSKMKLAIGSHGDSEQPKYLTSLVWVNGEITSLGKEVL